MRLTFSVVTTLLATSILGVYSVPSEAGSFSVYVGYADNFRPNAYFPNPWNGSANTIFLGGSNVDSGAILIQNNTGSSILVNSLVVSGFDNGAVFNLWGTPGTLPNGDYMILTGYNENDFDTSDQLKGFTYPDSPGSGFTPTNPYTGNPEVALTIDGTQYTYADTGHILDTGGYDLASFPSSSFPNNESLQWRPVGTTGIEDPAGNPPGSVPEPSSIVMCLIGVAGGLRCAGRRHRKFVGIPLIS